MKQFLTTLTFLLFFGVTFSQISKGGLPPSSMETIEISEIDRITCPAPDITRIQEEDNLMEKHGTFRRNGRVLPLDLNMENSGTWSDLPSGGSIWRLTLQYREAKALMLYFDEFYMPANARLFIYGKEKRQILGAYTQANNTRSGLFAHELIYGDEISLEYYQQSSGKDGAKLNINNIAYIYRDAENSFFRNTAGFGDSDFCEVNVNCSPEGDNWQDEKRGAVRILLTAGPFTGWCSGSLINNVRQDCTPYMLTADHCGDGASTAQYNQWIFYFNYEASSCNTSSQPSSNTLTGSTKVANGGNSGSTGSDFLLLELNSNIPQNFNAYFNGWDKRNVVSSSGVSIHHPSGDIKKISTYSQNLVSSSWGGNPHTHWRVTWASTTNGHGVTEGGSSGSPIFNSAGRIIGDLTGGSSYCSALTSPDLYGKLSYSWASNGTNANQQLKSWLDPENTGVETLNGKEALCSNEAPVAAFTATQTTIITGNHVSYTDQSQNDPHHWKWLFEGVSADTSVQQNPFSILYNTPGQYDVSLIVWNDMGYDTLVMVDYITVLATPADLDILNSAITPPTAHAAEIVEAACTIKNQGQETAQATVLNFYLSENYLLDQNDLLLDSMMVDSIEAGAQISVSKNMLIPASFDAGAYYFLFEADAEDSVFEGNELNNTSFNNLNIIEYSVDLELISFLPDSTSMMASNSSNVSYNLVNHGDTLAEGASLGVYLSENNLFNSSDLLIHSEIPANIDPGQQLSLTFDLSIPDSIDPGNYYLIAFIDHEEVLEESNENNNQMTVEIEVTHNVGIDEYLSPDDIVIVPNPNNGHFILQMSGSKKMSFVTISDYTGRIVKSFKTDFETTDMEIETKHLANGTYLLQVTNNSGSASKLFIISK